MIIRSPDPNPSITTFENSPGYHKSSRAWSYIAYAAVTPPSTDKMLPVVQLDSSDAK